MSADKIVVECSCGKRYKSSPEKIGKTMRCKACGSGFTVQPAGGAYPQIGAAGVEVATTPSVSATTVSEPGEPGAFMGKEEDPQDVVDRPAPPPFKLKRAKRIHVDKDMKQKNPDELMSEIHKTRLGGTLAISIVVHIVLLAATSVGFTLGYIKDAKKYETWDIALIEQAKEQEKKEAGEAKRKAEIERKRKEREAKLAQAEKEKQKALAEAKKRQAEGGGDGESAVEKNVSEVIMERPSEPSLQGIRSAEDLGIE
jgi:hypothetical protein